MGRTWLIPCKFAGQNTVVENAIEKEAAVTETEIEKDQRAQSVQKTLCSLMDGEFEPGQCWEYVQSIPEGVQRDVLTSQYYYFCGQAEQAVSLAEPYLDHEDPVTALIASVVYCFANLNRGKAHLFQIGQQHIRKYAEICLRTSQDPQVRAYAVYITTMVHVLMHVECPPMPALASELQNLPMGSKLHAGYLMAYEAYLEKDYSRCLGMVEMLLAMCGDSYVIPATYLHVMASIALMNQRRITEAKNQFEQAWQLVRSDDLTAIIGEHTGLLQGLLEVSLKRRHPEEYQAILNKAALFAEGWRKVHNARTNRTVADQLTAVEMAIASLFHRGWAVKEISAYMEISPRMVRHHISTVYEKLGISHREDLARYMVL